MTKRSETILPEPTRPPDGYLAVDRGTSLNDLTDPCTASELAAALSRSPKTIIDWCQEKAYTRLPCFKIGNRWYHRPEEVKRWVRGIQSGQVEFRRKPRSGERS